MAGMAACGFPALSSQVIAWMLATQARLGMPSEARAAPRGADDEWASSGEIRDARAVICLAEGDPAGALDAVQPVLDGTAPVIGDATVVEADLIAGLAHRRARRPARGQAGGRTGAGPGGV